MLNFNRKQPKKPRAFTLDPVERERAKGYQEGRRRPIHSVFMVGVIIATCYLMYDFMDGLRNSLAPVTDRLNQELPLEPMARPTIATLPPLPDDAAIAEHRAGVKLADIPLWIEQPDAPTMAWIEQALKHDLATPPLPQRVEARDLILRHVKVGQNLVVSGLLEDSQPAPVAGSANGYQRLLVKLPDEQYLEVLAPESARDLLIGDEIVVVGRYLGFAALPRDPAAAAQPAGGAPPTAPPVVAEPAPESAPAAAPASTGPVQVPLIVARTAAKPTAARANDDTYVMRGEWRMPADIYQNVDDDLLVVETRPYYFTIGQVLLDRTTPEAMGKVENANAMGTAIHREPSKYRGQPFTIRGHVFHAWEDPGVAQDQPFGVSRVVRIIMWSEDWGEVDFQKNGEIKTERKLILRAFELAAITHQPLPQPGEVITATGRFLRVRSMEVKPNVERDRRMGIKRQSDRAHTFLFVTNEFTALSPRPTYDFSIFGIVMVVAALLLGAGLIWVTSKESKKKEEVFDTVRKFRESRHALKKKGALGSPTAAADGTGSPPTGSAPTQPAPADDRQPPSSST